MSVTYSLSKAGLEVYTTTPLKKKISFADSSDTEATNHFNLENGETTQIDYIGELYSDSYEQDYTDISTNSSITLPLNSKYYNLLWKGRKMALKKGLQEDTLKWDDMDTVIVGFATEISYTTDKINLKITGMNTLLDKEKKFKFKKTKMSKIITNIIESAGLKAKIDVTGLDDKVINFTNISTSSSSNSSSSSSLAGGEGATVDELVADICGNETDDLKKCKLIHKWLQENVRYEQYACSRYSKPEDCIKNKGALNCADTARLTRAMMASAGLKCYVAHHSQGPGHFWTVIEIGGKKYTSDQTGDGSEFDTVWYPSGRTGSGGNGGNSDANCGKNPSC